VTKHSESDKSIFETQIQNSENFNGQSNKRRKGSWSKILITEGGREGGAEVVIHNLLLLNRLYTKTQKAVCVA